MDTLSIRQKLFLVFGILIAIFTANGIFTGYNMNSINDGAMRIVTKLTPDVLSGTKVMATLADYQRGEYAIATATSLSPRIYAIQNTKKLGDQIDIVFKNLEPAIHQKDQADFQEMKSNWEDYKKKSQEAILLAKANEPQKALAMIEASQQNFDSIANKLNIIVNTGKDSIHAESDNSASQYAQTKWMLIICILLVILISAFMAFYLSRSMMHSIEGLMEVSKKLSDGDLTVEVKATTKDEFGELTMAYGETVRKLRELIEHIQNTANEVSAFAAQLTENASQSAQATQQVATSITNVAANSSQQVSSVEQSLIDVEAMSRNLLGFEEKASASESAARNVENIASRGKTAITGAIKQMTEISSSVTDSANVIQKLAERSTEIGDISSTISGIAEQTNLLSLNAAIEAARAGEAGRGFSVVAEEVRKLAEGSSLAAQKIADLISSIQKETEQAVVRMQKGTRDVENGQAIMKDASDSFDTITNAVSNLTEHAKTILKDAKESSLKAENLVDVMKKINQSGYDVAAETESVSAATEEQSASMDEVAAASQKLSELATELTDSTARFKI